MYRAVEGYVGVCRVISFTSLRVRDAVGEGVARDSDLRRAVVPLPVDRLLLGCFALSYTIQVAGPRQCRGFPKLGVPFWGSL